MASVTLFIKYYYLFNLLLICVIRKNDKERRTNIFMFLIYLNFNKLKFYPFMEKVIKKQVLLFYSEIDFPVEIGDTLYLLLLIELSFIHETTRKMLHFHHNFILIELYK